MLRLLARAILILLPLAVLSAVASADSVPIGTLALDPTGANSGEFDITNLTGSNALPPDFPVTSSLTLSITSLVVNFSGGSSVTLTSANFSSDGFGGFNGSNSFNLLTSPITSAVLTGSLSPTSGLSGVTGGSLNTAFSATLTDAAGNLALGDAIVIDATTGTSTSGGGGGGTGVPEPGTLLLLGSGAFALVLRRKRAAA
jgi:hypothetical protein